VLPDDFQGGRTAGFAVLEARRHQRAFVVGEDPTTQALAGPLRLKGIRSAMSSGDAEIAGVVRCDWNVSEAYDAVDALLSSGARPTALICLNDRVALGAYQALGSHGCDIPGDVAVVSFDASELAGWLRPTLSSVALPFKDLGATAVRRLLRPEPGEPQVVRLPMPLFRGGSMPSPSAVT
jgi:LacI family transcriptional regulator